MATAIELESSRELTRALDDANKALEQRLATEKQTSALLTELNATRRRETDALRATVAAKDEALAAKTNVIDAQDKLIAELKKHKRSTLSRITDILIGAGAALILK